MTCGHTKSGQGGQGGENLLLQREGREGRCEMRALSKADPATTHCNAWSPGSAGPTGEGLSVPRSQPPGLRMECMNARDPPSGNGALPSVEEETLQPTAQSREVDVGFRETGLATRPTDPGSAAWCAFLAQKPGGPKDLLLQPTEGFSAFMPSSRSNTASKSLICIWARLMELSEIRVSFYK